MKWQPIETAPKDGTSIVGYCNHEADSFIEKGGTMLTDYAARHEGMSHVDDGAHVISWDDAYEVTDGWEAPSFTMPGWWVLACDSEVAANPTHWIPLPEVPSLRKEAT